MSGSVELYFTQINNQLDAARFAALCELLPEKMREKVGAFRKWEDAHASLLGKLLLRKAISPFGLSLADIRYTEFEKPYFDGPFDFSIGHSGDFVVCALSASSRVGVDIERIKDFNPDDFAYIFSTPELQSISGAPSKLVEFFRLWTRKEAVLKADGLGLNYSLERINTIPDVVHLNGIDWNLTSFDLDEHHIITVCVNQPDYRIEMRPVSDWN